MHAALAAVGRPAARWSTLVETLSADPQTGGTNCRGMQTSTARCRWTRQADELDSLGARLAETCDGGWHPGRWRCGPGWCSLPNSTSLRSARREQGGRAVARDDRTAAGDIGHVFDRTVVGRARPSRRSLKRPRPPFSAPSPEPPRPQFSSCATSTGGRNRYAGLLQHFFPDEWIETLVESRAESRYHWARAIGRVEVAFRAAASRFCPPRWPR